MPTSDCSTIDTVNPHGVWPWYLVADTLNKPEQPAPTYLTNKKHHVSPRQKALWHPSTLSLMAEAPAYRQESSCIHMFSHLRTVSLSRLSSSVIWKLGASQAEKRTPKMLKDSFTPLIQQLHCRARCPCCNLFSEIWWGGVSWNAGPRCLFQNFLTVTGTSSDGEIVSKAEV